MILLMLPMLVALMATGKSYTPGPMRVKSNIDPNCIKSFGGHLGYCETGGPR